MKTDQGRIPIFAAAVSVVMILVGLNFAYMFFFRPESVVPDLDMTNASLRRLATILGTRSLAQAVALIVALALRTRLGLIAALTMRAVTETFDLFTFPADPNNHVMQIVVLTMIAAELASIVLLWRAASAGR